MAATTVARQRDSNAGCLAFILLGGILMAIFGMLVMAGLPEVSDHATKKHGAEAINAYDYVNNMPGYRRRFCRHNCPDGRTRYVCNIKGTSDFAIVVVEAERVITSFVSSQDYAVHVLEDQCGGSRFAHP